MARSSASWRVSRRVAITVTAALALGGCASSEDGSETATTPEKTVCDRLQDMITALADERHVDAVTAYDAMLAWAAEAPDDDTSDIITAARRMGAITDERVDESELLMSEVSDLANRAMIASGDQLGVLVAGCEQVGSPVTGLDDAGSAK